MTDSFMTWIFNMKFCIMKTLSTVTIENIHAVKAIAHNRIFIIGVLDSLQADVLNPN